MELDPLAPEIPTIEAKGESPQAVSIDSGTCSCTVLIPSSRGNLLTYMLVSILHSVPSPAHDIHTLSEALNIRFLGRES